LLNFKNKNITCITNFKTKERNGEKKGEDKKWDIINDVMKRNKKKTKV